MPTEYVSDYEALIGNKPEQTAEAEPVAEAKVVEAEDETPAPKKTAKARTK